MRGAMKILSHLFLAVLVFLVLAAFLMLGSPGERFLDRTDEVEELEEEVRKGRILADKVPQLRREIQDLSLKLEDLQVLMQKEGFGELYQAHTDHRCFQATHHIVRRMGLLEEDPEAD
jgi:hypothetical protein